MLRFALTKNKMDTLRSNNDNEIISDEQSTSKRKNSSSYKSSDDEDDEKLTDYLLKKENDDDENDYEEKNLEELVFGSEAKIFSNIEKIKKKKKKFSNKINHEQKKLADDQSLGKRKPVWHDTDDQEIVDVNTFSQFSSVVNTKTNEVETSQIEESLKARFKKYYGTPIWADLQDSKQMKKYKNDESSSEDANNSSNEDIYTETIFQETGNYLANTEFMKTKSSLPKLILDIKVCTDANKEEPHQARLKTVEFHPSARVLLTAGLNQKLTLFQIDGKNNPKIQSIFIDKFPILSAHFTKQSGDEIIMGSRHKNFYYYDMHSGKIITVVPPVKALDEFQRPSISANFEISPDNKIMAFVGSQGQIHLFSVKSKEWIDSLKINDSCNAITFSSDSRYLFAFGDDKTVNVFDMNDRGHLCFHKFNDFGCLSGTSIAISNNSQFIATGCKSGVVNIYNFNDALSTGNKFPKPLKSFMNLTTPCTSLKFNNTSEILAACSEFSENACKLIHVGSLSVFGNFPVKNDLSSTSSSLLTKMRIPQCIDFSLNSGYFTIGNHKGNALLYRLKHYGSF